MSCRGQRPILAIALPIVPLVIACTPTPVTYVNTLTPTAMPVTMPSVNGPDDVREKLAVLPIDDEALFRNERSLLRFELTAHVARLVPDRIIVPLAEVDAKISPVSRSTGHLCAYESEPVERRARQQGWQLTRIFHVGGLRSDPSETLWVEIVDGLNPITTLVGPWNSHVPRVNAYRAAFAGFVKKDRAGVLGGLGAQGSYENALREGPITVCEMKSFGSCEQWSVDWRDRIGAAAACFSGAEDEVTRDLLVQGDVGPFCEMENLDFPNGREAQREACLCKALGTSAAMGKRPGRRTIRVHYEASDIAGKPRPELRVIETTTNLHAEDEWHSMGVMVNGKKQYRSVRRLVVDNLDAVAAPLSRCSAPVGNPIIADVDVREDGAAMGGRVISPVVDKQTQACIEQAFARGAFNCTDDGQPGRVRVAMEWRAP